VRYQAGYPALCSAGVDDSVKNKIYFS